MKIELPWNVSLDDFQSRTIPSKEATELVRRNRAGNEQSKNKGFVMSEPETGDLVETWIPVDLFDTEYLKYIRDTVNEARVNRYMGQRIETPIYVVLSKKMTWGISDGGHRLTAAIRRGDSFIRALVPVQGYEKLLEYKQSMV